MTLLHIRENSDILHTSSDLPNKNVLASDKDLYILYGIIIIMFYFFSVIRYVFYIRVYTMYNK